QPLVAVGHHELGCPRGRGCAQVGDEIGDREIDLVPDGAHRGNGAGRDGPGDRLLVEGPQVLEGAAAAPDDEHVAFGARRRGPERPDELARRGLSLHGGGVDDDRHRRKAPPEDGDNVANRGPGGRRDHADAARQGRQRPLALAVEQALRRELALQKLEAAPQLAFAGGFDGLRDELVLAARLVQAHAPENEHLVAVFERDARAPLALAEPAAADLRGGVFQAEVEVARGGACQVRNLAFHPNVPHAALDRLADYTVQVGNGQDDRRRRLQRHAHRRIIERTRPEFSCRALQNRVPPRPTRVYRATGAA